MKNEVLNIFSSNNFFEKINIFWENHEKVRNKSLVNASIYGQKLQVYVSGLRWKTWDMLL